MAYLVLARKYRPATLAELVGQEHIGRALSNALAMKRIPHAMLFCGARGTGKTSTARIVAKMLNCAQGPTDKPCGVCAACKEITAGQSIDVQELDAASNRGIDEVRELRSGVGYAPQRDRYKIYIVDEAHMLTDAAANAFLKTLEEPPPHVVFVLATTDPQKLPITIRSRCQRYDFRRVKAADVVQRLAKICDAEGVQFETDALYLVAREGDGSMRDSLSLLDQVIAFGGDKLDTDGVSALLGVADRGRMHLLLQSLVQRNAAGALLSLGAANDHGLDLRTLGRTLAMESRDLLLVRLAGNAARQLVDRSDSEIDTLRKLGEGASDSELERLSHVLLELAEQAARSRYPRLALEMGVVRLCRAPQMADVADLAARVEALLAAGPKLAPRSGSTLPPAAGSAPAGRPPPAHSGESRGPLGYAPAHPPAPVHAVMPAQLQGTAVAAAKNLLKPAAPPAPAPEPVADRDLPRLQTELREQGNPLLASLVDSLVVVRCGAHELVLGVANQFMQAQASEKDTFAELQDAANAAFGWPRALSVVVDPRARTDSAAARNARAREAKAASDEAELRALPAVKAVQEIFDATVVAVQLAGQEPPPS